MGSHLFGEREKRTRHLEGAWGASIRERVENRGGPSNGPCPAAMTQDPLVRKKGRSSHPDYATEHDACPIETHRSLGRAQEDVPLSWRKGRVPLPLRPARTGKNDRGTNVGWLLLINRLRKERLGISPAAWLTLEVFNRGLQHVSGGVSTWRDGSVGGRESRQSRRQTAAGKRGGGRNKSVPDCQENEFWGTPSVLV